MAKYTIGFSLKLDIIAKDICTNIIISDDIIVDNSIVCDYVNAAHKDIIDYIFYFYEEYSEVDIDGYEIKTTFDGKKIHCQFILLNKPNNNDLQIIKRQIRETIADGADTWYGSDIVVVDENTREMYQLKELPDNTWFHVFYDFDEFE